VPLAELNEQRVQVFVSFLAPRKVAASVEEIARLLEVTALPYLDE